MIISTCLSHPSSVCECQELDMTFQTGMMQERNILHLWKSLIFLVWESLEYKEYFHL